MFLAIVEIAQWNKDDPILYGPDNVATLTRINYLMGPAIIQRYRNLYIILWDWK